tara:strand:+ start:1876 stop:2799 length:924 start_codon:yes stop_codon:yes gene_type:complete
MIWEKLGFLWSAEQHLPWGSMGTLTPTPIRIDVDTIRVFCGIRDHSGVARIGYFDICSHDPTKVMAYSNEPVLDIGEPGAFDDNGMLLGDVIDVDGELRMYYVGFQLATKAKFLAFGGLATSTDGGRTFVRKFKTPVIDRDDSGLFIRAIHSIRRLSDGSFRAWYSEGCSWEIISGKPFPNYNIAVVDSPDGFRFDANQGAAVAVGREGEYRIGRSRVFEWGADQYIMSFTFGTRAGVYESGYATSSDMSSWCRQDNFGLSPGPDSFDSRHLAYPAVFRASDGQVFCLYNGNDMGGGGIGLARNIKF